MSHGPTPVFASLRSSVVTGKQHPPMGRPPTSISYTITNSMRCGVYWQNALGMTVYETPALSTTDEELLRIEIRYQFDYSATIDSRQLLNDINLPDNHAEKKGILEALNRIQNNPASYTQRTFSYTLGISRATLEQHGGLVYLNDVDLVVGFQDCQGEVLHPFSPPGRKARVTESMEHQEGFVQRYLLVDSSRTVGVRWINTGYEVIELVPVEDLSLEDGIYVTTKTSRRKPTTTFFTMDEAQEQLGVYHTRPEAETFGSPDARYKENLQKLDHAIKETQHQNTLLKQEYERERQEYERSKAADEDARRKEDDRRRAREAELEFEAKRAKAEADRREETLRRERLQFDHERDLFREKQKLEFETYQRERKDRSEEQKAKLDYLKYILGLCTVVAGAVVTFQKNRK